MAERPFAAGEVKARAEATIPIRSLKSVEKDGKPYSDKFDEVMYEKLGRGGQQTVNFRLERLVWTAVQKNRFVFASTGHLVIGGVTNTVHIPVSVIRLPAGQLRLTGSTSIKQDDFGIPPPIIDTEHPRRDYSVVTISFDWTLEKQKQDDRD